MNAKAQYDTLSGLYDIIFSGILHPGRRKLIRNINRLPASRLLEVGIGTGLSLKEYDARHRITGIDISGRMIERARRRRDRMRLANVDLIEMDAENLRFADNSFDVVVALYVVSTVNDPGRLMAEIERVCRPGGRIFILNHFSAGLRRIEKWLLPVTTRIGWKSYFERTQIDRPTLRLASARRANLFGYWQLLEFESVR